MGTTINYPLNIGNNNNDEILLPQNQNFQLIQKTHFSTSNYIYKKYFCEKNKKFINKEQYTLIRCNICLCYPFIKIIPYICKINILLKCNCGLKNISLNEIYEKYISNPINNLSCSKHLNNEAEKYCLNCKLFLCKYCNLWHIKKYNKIHKIENIDSVFNICKKHGNNYFGFCNKCQLNICDCCTEHQNHTIILFQRYQKLINIKEKIKKIFEYEKNIFPEIYNENNYDSNNIEIKKNIKERNIELLNLLKYFIYIYNVNIKNLNFQILYNIDMNSSFNPKNSMNKTIFVEISNIPISYYSKPVHFYNNYDIEDISYSEKEQKIIVSKKIDFILPLQNGSLLFFSGNLITQYEDDTFTNKREIKLILESENIIKVEHACEMNNNGKIVYITGIKLVIFSLIDFSSQEFIRQGVIDNFKCLENNNIIIKNELSIIILKVNEKENNEETIQFNKNNFGRIISINTFSKCFIVEMLKGYYNSYNNNNLNLIQTLSTNNNLSSSMPAIKFDENKLITFYGDSNIHYLNILNVKNLQFVSKIYLNYNYFNRLNVFKLPDNNILILMNNFSFFVIDGINYNVLVKRNFYYPSHSIVMTKSGKLICGTRPLEFNIFEYSNLFYN